MEKIKLSSEAENFIKTEVSNGTPLDKIAKRVFVSTDWLVNHVKVLGLVDKDSVCLPVKITDEDVPDILNLYGRGVSIQDIAETVDRSESYVDHVLISMKVKKKPKKQKRLEATESEAETLKLLQKSYSVDLLKIHDVSETPAKNLCKDSNTIPLDVCNNESKLKAIENKPIRTGKEDKLVKQKVIDKDISKPIVTTKIPDVLDPKKDIAEANKKRLEQLNDSTTKVANKKVTDTEISSKDGTKTVKTLTPIKANGTVAFIKEDNKKRGRGSRIPEAEKQDYAKRYQKGETIATIATVYGRSVQLVSGVLKDMGVFQVKTRTKPKVESEKVEKPATGLKKTTDSIQKVKDKKPSNKAKSKTKAKEEKDYFTMEEKIAYCDAYYGKGNYRFMTRDEIREALRRDLNIIKR